MALLFFPRGGSSQVARYLARFLPGAGWDVTLAAGSLGPPGEASHAGTFFARVEDLHAVDYTAGLEMADPLSADPPFQPSFEDRPEAPDRVFAAVDDEAYERLVSAWIRELGRAGAAEADALHLHHLTPMNEAAERAFPDVPRVGHLHGTELLMLREIDGGAPTGWDHAEAWAERMRRWARGCERLLVLSPDAARRVPDLLGVEPGRVVAAANGFDPDLFKRRPATGSDRTRLWRSWLVEEPRGWDASGRPGSVAYTAEALAPFADDAPVLLYVGRYTEVKRLPLLIRAHARARERYGRRVALVLLGGYPGEWEGPHPLEVIRDVGAEDVFLAGWRSHEELPTALNAADVLVLPSVREQFGQVLVEAMACGLPVIAVNAWGPTTIVEPGRSGWLVEPDDEDDLVEALVAAVRDPERRRSMGARGEELSQERYGWPALAAGVARVYEAARGGEPAAAEPERLTEPD